MNTVTIVLVHQGERLQSSKKIHFVCIKFSKILAVDNQVTQFLLPGYNLSW